MRDFVTFLSAFLMFTAIACAQDDSPQVEWSDKLSTALEQAGETNKRVLIEFVSDSCDWCSLMAEQTFSNEKVVSYMGEHFVPMKINADAPGRLVFNGRQLTPRQFALALGIKAYPTYIVLVEDGDGMRAIPFEGYHKPDDFLVILNFFVDKAYENMSYDEYRNSKS